MNGYAAISGFALLTTDKNVDLPTDGNPTRPTSANNFSSTSISFSSPFTTIISLFPITISSIPVDTADTIGLSQNASYPYHLYHHSLQLLVDHLQLSPQL